MNIESSVKYEVKPARKFNEEESHDHDHEE